MLIRDPRVNYARIRPSGNYMFKVNNRTRSEIYLKLTIKTQTTPMAWF